MASLPAQHPRLALHLTDRALTPIISTSLPPPSSSSSSSSSPASTTNHRATFTTSPPTPSPPPSLSHEPQQPPSSSPKALSLTTLTATALTAHQTAKRLSHGAPLRTMIEYPARGPVILHSYLCPMSLALGTPGLRRSSSHGSLTTAVGGAAAALHDDDDDDDDKEDRGDNGGGGGGGGGGHGAAAAAAAAATATERDQDPDVPMLIATVVAPGAHDLKEARRAAGRLEQVAKAVQTEWIAEGS